MRRHDRVVLKAGATALAVTCCTTDAAPVIREWIAAGRAFVYPRQTGSSASLSLGLAFVQNGIRHRALVRVGADDVEQVSPPLSLSECLHGFASQDAIVLRDLVQRLAAAGHTAYVYGSVAWEQISGVVYRHAKSDLDMLIDVATSDDLQTVVAALRRADDRLPFRIDGELRFPNGHCVHWREAAMALDQDCAYEVIVKDESGAYLGTLDTPLEIARAA